MRFGTGFPHSFLDLHLIGCFGASQICDSGIEEVSGHSVWNHYI